MRLRRLLSRYESTSLPAELLAAELPDDAGNQDDLRTLALLRWHRYRNLPGVEGVPERWAGGGGHPVVALWACPAARPCDRLVPGDERPRCELLDEPFVTRKIAL